MNLLVKNLKSCHQVLLIYGKFLVLKLLKTKCNSVQERVKNTATLYVSLKNTISGVKRTKTSTKIQMLPQFFSSSLCYVNLNCKTLMKYQIKLILPNKCRFRSWKGSNIWRTLFYSVYSVYSSSLVYSFFQSIQSIKYI